jgi:hypothetical protein
VTRESPNDAFIPSIPVTYRFGAKRDLLAQLLALNLAAYAANIAHRKAVRRRRGGARHGDRHVRWIVRALCSGRGLTGAIASSHIILTAGFAEIAAGSIAMGLGGYLAARSDAEHYASERLREEQGIATVPDVGAQEVRDIFKSYGLNDAESASVVQSLRQRPKIGWIS